MSQKGFISIETINAYIKILLFLNKSTLFG